MLAHLTAVGEDVVAKVSELLSEAPGQVAVPEALRKLLSSAPLERYLVNVLVDRDAVAVVVAGSSVAVAFQRSQERRPMTLLTARKWH